MKTKFLFLSALPFFAALGIAAAPAKKPDAKAPAPNPASVYCKYCGAKYPDAKTLLKNRCPHIFAGKGKHVLFEGEEASKYICENCGTVFSSLKDLTRNTCPHKTELVPVHVPYRGGIKAEYTPDIN